MCETDLSGISDGTCISSETLVTLSIVVVCFLEYAEDYNQFEF